ncbi:TauD/TfdA family dioxygenase [Nocardia sp. CA2R105]|uniref:TauD/TfdA dioxygenase family protein n=1 Tax=Nocardia coffeae TaxID=2873381 RepID=UPI001CA65BE4|nr:TauD/TfdA family dioxygenase [Nocardia coffeae]MBY8860772.1 TauD/TfdA family dioxygenase [Nocardia coffeae]
MNTHVIVHKLGLHIGARIDGVRLDGNLDPMVVADINQALLEHKVIFFRDQHHLDDEQQYAFGELLGTPFAHHAQRDGDRITPIDSGTARATSWHTDMTFMMNFPKASILRAVKLPAYGGTTLWASTAAAYQSLPGPLKQLAESLRAIHGNRVGFVQQAGSPELVDKAKAASFAAAFTGPDIRTEHPVVRVHPETGERVLLLGRFADRLVGFDTRESQALIQLLQDHITVPEHSIRWNWNYGDVAIWDNRATQHRAVSDYGDQHRLLHRVTLAGDVPVDIHGQPSTSLSGADAYPTAGQEDPILRRKIMKDQATQNV